MPIKPENKALYPADWNKISRRIREEAGNKCEKCGILNGSLIIRNPNNPDDFISSDRWEWVTLAHLPEFQGKPKKIVLTVHHIDHNPQNCVDDNLICLCQRCHLILDAKHHAENAKATRRARLHANLKAAGQRGLWDD